MMNKPTVLSTGEWLMPAAVWDRDPRRPELAAERHSNVHVSRDEGRTWAWLGGAETPQRAFDEHMVVERRDGSLWMLIRTQYGVGESVSLDRGRTWSEGRPSAIPGPNSRFFIRRLRSGRLLLVNHHGFTGRSHLTAMLSEDDGLTWPARLLLDERKAVSYPDGIEAPDGRLFIIYDFNRQSDREILLAVLREEDILSGRCVSPDARLRVCVDRAG
jgi:predicted neuraminidase